MACGFDPTSAALIYREQLAISLYISDARRSMSATASAWDKLPIEYRRDYRQRVAEMLSEVAGE